MNRAAESARRLLTHLQESHYEYGFSDAKGILMGGNTAATEYFQADYVGRAGPPLSGPSWKRQWERQV